jgi:hypothetical protein
MRLSKHASPDHPIHELFVRRWSPSPSPNNPSQKGICVLSSRRHVSRPPISLGATSWRLGRTPKGSSGCFPA